MADLPEIMKSIDDLTPQELGELNRYIANRLSQLLAQTAEDDLQPRVMGLHAHLGAAWMSDDFLDELPDSFWLGEESTTTC